MTTEHKPHSMSRLEVIRFAWSDEDVEPMLRGAQEDIKYLIEQLEAAKHEFRQEKIRASSWKDFAEQLQEQYEALREASQALLDSRYVRELRREIGSQPKRRSGSNSDIRSRSFRYCRSEQASDA